MAPKKKGEEEVERRRMIVVLLLQVQLQKKDGLKGSRESDILLLFMFASWSTVLFLLCKDASTRFYFIPWILTFCSIQPNYKLQHHFIVVRLPSFLRSTSSPFIYSHCFLGLILITFILLSLSLSSSSSLAPLYLRATATL